MKDSFHFAPSGFYTIIGKEEVTYPLLLTLFSHLLYIALWSLCLLLTPLFSLLIFVHLFFFGCRLTTLLIHAPLKFLLFPPLYEKVTRRLHKQPTLALLESYHLADHPGLLSNLALIQHRQNHPELPLTLKRLDAKRISP